MSDGIVQEVSGDASIEAGGLLNLDPFAYLPGVASKIGGLGGNAPGHDGSYVFHTHYVPVSRGNATFTARFSGLTGKRGTLFISIHMLATEAGAQVRLVASERILMNRLVQRGGEASIRFEGYNDVHYAFLGAIVDATDAEAHGLTVTLDLAEADAEYDGPPIEARNTAYGTDAMRPRPHLLSLDAPTIAAPVSQACTPAQFAEPAFATWAKPLKLDAVRSRRNWAFAYVIQVLRLYGLLQPGARGVGFGVHDEPVPAFLAANGVSTVATDRGPGHELSAGEANALREALRVPGIADAAAFDAHVAFRSADPAAIPRDLVNFDFAWSIDAASRLGSIMAALNFLRGSIRCLRPGGLAVHVMDYDLRTGGAAPIETPEITLLRRNDLEQVAVDLISLGHEVAQIKIESGKLRWRQHVDLPGDAAPEVLAATANVPGTAFGIVVRRAPGH